MLIQRLLNALIEPKIITLSERIDRLRANHPHRKSSG